MKYLIVAALLVHVCTVSSQRSHPGAMTSQLSLGKVAELTHHRAKRQTAPTTQDDIVDCTSTVFDYLCSSGYAQRVIDIALGCRDGTYPRGIAAACATSEMSGDFCGTAALRFVPTDQSQAADASTCLGVIATGSCPSSCRSFLESAKSMLGCCINTYINTTFNSFAEFYNMLGVFDYRLWNLCNVPLPAADCENGLTINSSLLGPRDCTTQELFSRLANHACTPSVGQPLVDTLLQNSKCYSIARELVDLCSINANWQFCAAIVGSPDAALINTEILYSDSSFTSLIANCGSSLSSQCSSSCQNAIADFADSYGCCVNSLNNTSTGDNMPELSYGLWTSCGVQTPRVCAITSTLTTSGAATMKVFSWMIGIAKAIQMALHI